MQIQDTKMIDIVPTFMRDDRTVRGLCAAADAMFLRLIDAVHLAWWRKYIDELEADQLDDLAKQIGITWYDDGSDIISKRNVLKNYENVLAIAGTPDAVKYAVKDLFGDVEIIEWPEYGGQPYHFKMIIDAKLTEDNTKRFDVAVSSMKNVRSIMDSLDVMRKSSMKVYAGGALTNLYICEVKQEV